MEKLKSHLKINPEKLTRSLENFIQEFMNKLERDGVILGLSGGLDSAVGAALCQRAVGPKKTLALIMPEADSQKEHLTDALNFARELGIKTKLIKLTPYLKKMGIYKLFPLNKIPFPRKLKELLVKKALGFYQEKTHSTVFSATLAGFKNKPGYFFKKTTAYYRIKHRLRMILLYLYAELENKLVVGTANKSEYQTGFFVKYGCDHAADIMPIINLYKTQVRELAKYLKIPAHIIEKAPSPDLLPGLTDEATLGISYEKLDLILAAQELGLSAQEIAGVLQVAADQVKSVIDLTRKSEPARKIYLPENILENK